MDSQKKLGLAVLVMTMVFKAVDPDWIQLPLVEPDDENVKSKPTTYNITHTTTDEQKEFGSNGNTLPQNVDSILTKSLADKTGGVHRKTNSEENFIKLNVKKNESESGTGKTTKEHNNLSLTTVPNDGSFIGSVNANEINKTIHSSDENLNLNYLYNSSVTEDNFGSDLIHKMEGENLVLTEKPIIPTVGVNWSGSIPSFDILRSVHQTLVNEIPSSVDGKMKFLQKLQNKMLHYMEKRIKHLWESDTMRQSRTDKGMSFPSLDGALMSISFLIFAVFLIKLVQQLIHKLQASNMSIRQLRPKPDLLTTARVLKLVDEFSYQYHKMEDQS